MLIRYPILELIQLLRKKERKNNQQTSLATDADNFLFEKGTNKGMSSGSCEEKMK